jgi:ADP-ribose pyrophosphatase YjhB (NUDIX family)
MGLCSACLRTSDVAIVVHTFAGESIAACAVREVLEETGLHIRNNQGRTTGNLRLPMRHFQGYHTARAAECPSITSPCV